LYETTLGGLLSAPYTALPRCSFRVRVVCEERLSRNRKNGRPALTELVEPNARCAGSVLPSAPTHSDLEAGHGLMEPEFAAVERSCGDVRVF